MVKLKIGETVYGLRMDMYAMEQIEDEFGSIKDMFENVQGGSAKTVRILFRILANSQLSFEGKEENITGDELKHLKVPTIKNVGNAIRAAIEEGMKSETTGGAEADDEVYDVYLNEIEEKN